VVLTPGGAGIGDPAQRDAALVSRDIAEELVSAR
jgi:N-methylhydantoinase B